MSFAQQQKDIFYEEIAQWPRWVYKVTPIAIVCWFVPFPGVPPVSRFYAAVSIALGLMIMEALEKNSLKTSHTITLPELREFGHLGMQRLAEGVDKSSTKIVGGIAGLGFLRTVIRLIWKVE